MERNKVGCRQYNINLRSVTCANTSAAFNVQGALPSGSKRRSCDSSFVTTCGAGPKCSLQLRNVNGEHKELITLCSHNTLPAYRTWTQHLNEVRYRQTDKNRCSVGSVLNGVLMLHHCADTEWKKYNDYVVSAIWKISE